MKTFIKNIPLFRINNEGKEHVFNQDDDEKKSPR